ncbi:MAG: nuclear transport factor 2 family protein [Betaproteobacteria bacterium]
MRSEALHRLVHYWQTLTPETVASLAAVYTEDASFRDPFNDVTGIEAIKHLFAGMFVRLDAPRFTIIETIEQEQGAMLIWDFDFRIKALKPEMKRRIHGASHIRFAADGRVHYHRDYWDAAGELYAQLPAVGGLMRFLKKRMA